MKMGPGQVQDPTKVTLDIVLINGRTFAGKDTQAKLMVATDSEAVRLSPGQILRDVVAGRNGYRKYFDFEPKKLRADLLAGRLVDGEILANGFSQIVIDEVAKGKRRVIVAGWPREEKSFEVFKDLVTRLEAEGPRVKTHFVYLKASEEETRIRFAKELRKKTEARGRRELREDDTWEGFNLRNDTFNNLTEPFLLEHWMEFGLLCVESGRTKRQTQERLLRALSDHGFRSAEGQVTLPAQARR